MSVSLWRLKSAFVLLACSLSALPALAQYVDPLDYHNRADHGKKILADKDGSIYVAGSGTNDALDLDFVLTKYTQDPTTNHLVFQWTRFYDGLHGDDTVSGLALDGHGNVYVSGTSPGSLTSGTGEDVAVVGWDSGGHQLWSGLAARYDSGGGSNDIANAMTIDAAGNLIIVGSSSTGIRDGLVVVFRSDGVLKWANHYDAGNDEVFNAVATDGSKIFAAGQSVGLGGNDMLVVRYTTGGAVITPPVTIDYASGADAANAVCFTQGTRVAVAGYVTASDGQRRAAVYGIDEGYSTPVWSQIYTETHSEANAVTYVDSYVYAAGTTYPALAPSQMLTEKLALATGARSGWPDSLHPGIRLESSTLGGNGADAIWEQGSNIYVSGFGNFGGTAEPDTYHSDYLVTRYSQSGNTPSPFPSYYPGGGHIHKDEGFAVADYCAGQVVVTGDLYATAHDFDMGNLLYSQQEDTHFFDAFAVDMGVRLSGNLASLEYSDDDYMVIQRGYPSLITDPPISMHVTGTISGTPSELCVEIESHGEVGISQQVQILNNTTMEWQTLDFRPCSTTGDQVLHLPVSDDPAHYISGTSVQVRVRYFVTATPLHTNWTASIDQLVIRTTP